jgi:hypothetical protein
LGRGSSRDCGQRDCCEATTRPLSHPLTSSCALRRDMLESSGPPGWAWRRGRAGRVRGGERRPPRASARAAERRRSVGGCAARGGRCRATLAWREFYAARDHRTSASAIRSHDRRRLRRSASAVAASRFPGIAASRASTARLSRRSTFFVSWRKRTCQRTTARSYLSTSSSARSSVSSSASARPTNWSLVGAELVERSERLRGVVRLCASGAAHLIPASSFKLPGASSAPERRSSTSPSWRASAARA